MRLVWHVHGWRHPMAATAVWLIAWPMWAILWITVMSMWWMLLGTWWLLALSWRLARAATVFMALKISAHHP